MTFQSRLREIVKLVNTGCLGPDTAVAQIMELIELYGGLPVEDTK